LSNGHARHLTLLLLQPHSNALNIGPSESMLFDLGQLVDWLKSRRSEGSDCASSKPFRFVAYSKICDGYAQRVITTF